MMVPRSYMRPTFDEKSPVQAMTRRRNSRSPASLSSSPKSTKSISPSRNPAYLVARPSPSPISPHVTKDVSPRPLMVERMVSEPKETTTSMPMSIPTKKAATLDSVPKTRTRRASRNTNLESSIPPALASLLSSTSIPPPKGRPGRMKSTSSLPRRVSVERLREEWKKDATPAPFGTGSPLDFLLESADDVDCILMDDDDLEKKSMTMASRSVSSESITSTPSLEGDAGTYSSSFGSFSTPTPSLRRTPRSERKLCSPPVERCHEHPLLAIPIPEDKPLNISAVMNSPPPAASKGRFKFKSNLTASLQALKSAAKSFSNFTAPSLPSDDLLTRSLFASAERYTPEMRPRTFDTIPDPALRRYLNPTPPLSSPDFHSMLTDALGAKDPDPVKSGDAPMIPMQTYSRNGRKSRKQPPTERMESASKNAEPTTRQREPRENSDFLRVIVLEMNMRRVGKLDAKTGGRARVWLPPRKTSSSSIQVEGVQTVVPSRWASTTIDDLN